MFKKMIAFLLVAVMAIGTTTTSFAADKSPFTSSNSTRSGSYTYEDLGTARYNFCSDELPKSAALLAGVISGMATMSPEIALKTAKKVLNFADRFNNETVYYSLHTHRTLVKLDGEFSHYLIDETIYIYSDARHNNHIATVTHSGQSLDPTRVKDEVTK